MRDFVDTAVAACIEVARLIEENEDVEAYRGFERGAGGDVSIGFDLMAEALFVERLKSFGNIYSEESGWIEGEGEATILLDPIDGSDNLKSDFPYYGAAIALQIEGETRAAIVCNFANGDCFVKYQNHHYKTSLRTPEMHQKVTPHPYAKIGLFEKAAHHPEEGAALMMEGLKFRAPGAVALSLAYAHYVNYVVFFGTMRPYDIDAGRYLCENLHVFYDEGLLIVAKDQVVFDKLMVIFGKAL